MKTFRTVLLAALASLLAALACLAAEAPQPQGVFAEATAEGRDGSVVLRWKLDEAKAGAAGVKGVGVYSITAGDEAGFNVKSLKLVKDCGKATQFAVDGLENGTVRNFLLKPYGDRGEIEASQVLPGLPGAPAKGAPRAVRNVYAASGADAVAVFWERSPEAPVQGYEIARKAEGEPEFKVLGRVSKIVGVNHPTGGSSGRIHLPALRPCFYRDATVTPGVAYSYRVRAVDAKGEMGPEAVSKPLATRPARSPEPSEVLLLAVDGDDASLAVAKHYAEKRKVPQENILKLRLPKAAHLFRCEEHAARPVREHLLSRGLAGKIKVIVPCFGMPLGDGWRAVDSILTDPFGYYSWGRIMGTDNPLFTRDAHFEGTYGLYLVTRLDGPDAKTAMSLVDKALAAEASVTAASGAAAFADDDFGRRAAEAARRAGVKAGTQPAEAFKTLGLDDSVMWLFASGTGLRKLRDTPWPTGSVAAFLKSDSLVEVREAKPRSWVHGLLADGVTATFGAVVEPYVQGFTRGDVLFARFWTGEYCFAEAYLMATPTVRWAMSAVGDPLYKIGKPKKTD